MLLCSFSVTTGVGSMSDIACGLFSVLQFASLLSGKVLYNNHEYMYCTLAVLLALCGQNTGQLIHYNSSIPYPGMLWNQRSFTVTSSTSLLFGLTGCMYLMLQNAVYGIPSMVAPIGMSLIWASIVLLLGGQHQHAVCENENVDTDSRSTVGFKTLRSSSCSTDAIRYPTARWKLWALKLYFVVIYFFAGR